MCEIFIDLMISENSKSDSNSQEKEEDEELFFPGIHEYYNKRFVTKMMRMFYLCFEFVKWQQTILQLLA